MRIRKRWVIPAAVVLAAVVFAAWYWHHTTTPEYKARQLVAELRNEPPGTLKQWLIEHRFVKEKEPRDPWETRQDLVALGEPAVPVLIEALEDEDREVRSWAADALAARGESRFSAAITPPGRWVSASPESAPLVAKSRPEMP